MKIYLDNCCYNRPYDDQTNLKVSMETQSKLSIQDMIVNKEFELVTSYVLTTENSRNTVESKKENIKQYILSNTSVYVDIKHMDEIDKKAEKIMLTGIKYMDACHVACAILAGCDYFISTDRRLLNYKTEEIKLINPVDFIDIINDKANNV